MNLRLVALPILLLIPSTAGAQRADAERQDDPTPFEWASTPPEGTPLSPSETFRRVVFTGRYRNYTNADTWYPSWAADGHLYSPWTDGYILDPQVYTPFQDAHPGYATNSLDFMGRRAATAQARIEGDDPMELAIYNLEPRIEASPAPYGGRYPAGTLVHDGVWYYGTYALTNNPTSDCRGVGWTEFGPFVGFRISMDGGLTWTETPHSGDRPLFGENPGRAKIRIGAPHFVDFGQNMRRSPDGKAYLTAHGSTDPASCNNWIQADHVYLLRVTPSPETINDPSAYEFFAGHDAAGRPVWTTDLDRIEPVVDWPGRLGNVTATYNPGLNRYLMAVSRGTGAHTGDTMLLEAERITGPYRLVTYWTNFGPFAYFVNIPSKFISGDGRTFWLAYSANWAMKNRPGNPPGSHYSLSLHEVTLPE